MINYFIILLVFFVSIPSSFSSEIPYDFEDGEEIVEGDYIPSHNTPFYKDDCLTTTIQKELIIYSDLILNLDGVVNNPFDYQNSLKGFQNFLEDTNITNFSSIELGIPDNIEQAKKLGYEHLIPAQGCWLRGATLVLIAKQIRALVNSPIWAISWYRPLPYNNYIGGAPKSDHIQAKAIDFAFLNHKKRQIAQRYICENYWIRDEFDVSIGLGKSMIHLGMKSEHGKRWWIYKSFFDVKNGPSACWPFSTN